MEYMGEAEPLEPDEEPPPVRERDAEGLWADGLALASFGLALVSSVGPSGLVYLALMQTQYAGLGDGSERSIGTYLPFVSVNVLLAVVALVLGGLALRRAGELSPRWSRACSRAAVVTAATVLCSLAVIGAWYLLDEPATPEFDEFGEPVEQEF